MAYAEIEPWATKTLLLLRSSAETSLEEMRTMLMETIHQKYNGRKQYKMIPPLAGPNTEVYEKNKSKDSKSSSSDPKSKTHSTGGGFSPTVKLTSPESYASDSDSSSDNSDMVILEDDLVCVICKEPTTPQWNQFVECAECHSLYHQQCHVPPIPESDASDPRTVWYCRNCTKTVSKPKTSSTSSSSTTSQSNKNSSNKPSSTGRSNTSSPSFGSKPFGGVSMSSKKSSSSKNSQSSSNKVTPNLNMVSADKRLQIMKKKAARKQEKRPK